MHRSKFAWMLKLTILLAMLLSGCGSATPVQTTYPPASPVSSSTPTPEPPPASVTPTHLPATASLTPTDTPLPSPTLTATPAAPVVETRRWADVFAGPGLEYRKLASFAGGIPFDTTGRNAEASWVQIDLSPVQAGWIQLSDLEPSEFVTSLSEIAVAPPPTPTQMPQAASKILVNYRLEDSGRLFVTIDGLAKMQYYIIQILTDKGQVKVKRDFYTGQRSKMQELFEVAAWPKGNYTIQVLFSGKVVAQKGFTIERKK